MVKAEKKSQLHYTGLNKELHAILVTCFTHISITHLPLGRRHALVTMVLRLSRRFLHPDDDSNPGVGEEQYKERQKVLQDHDDQTEDVPLSIVRPNLIANPGVTETFSHYEGEGGPVKHSADHVIGWIICLMDSND